jgi:hypothetical protein
MKAIIAILTAIIYCLLCSCSTVGLYTKNQAINKFCRQDSTSFHYKDTIRDTVIIKGNTAEVNLDCEKFKSKYDSLLNAKSNLLDTDGFVKIYEDTNAAIFAKPNKDGSTKFKSKTKDKKQVIEKPIDLIITAPCNCPPCPEPPKLTFWEKVIIWVTNGLALIGILVLVILGFRYIISKLSN